MLTWRRVEAKSHPAKIVIRSPRNNPSHSRALLGIRVSFDVTVLSFMSIITMLGCLCLFFCDGCHNHQAPAKYIPPGLRKKMEEGGGQAPEAQRLAEEQAGVNVEEEDHDDGDDDGLAVMTAAFGRQSSTAKTNAKTKTIAQSTVSEVKKTATPEWDEVRIAAASRPCDDDAMSTIA
jgi:hypothetical protein